ncbi:MAG TPA: PEGA domain-containing protein [Ignavibacteriales bacterium]|nr:PEGA domain-containing protein [Ignavibacteriales bacterium]
MKKLTKTTGIILYSALILLSFSCGKEVSVSPPETPVHTGYFFINSNPAGADIYLNGKNTGRHTPDSLSWMEGDNYQVTLKYPLYKDTTFTISIEENTRKDTFVDYYSNPAMYGNIVCETDPKNAQIYLDGINSGKRTPFTFEHLIPGSHTVKYQYPGCRDDSMRIIVESSKTKQAYLKLKDTTIWVTYNTNNSGIPNNIISALLIDQNDVKWIGTMGAGVVRFDGVTWQSFNSKNSLMPNDFITCMIFDEEGHLWAGTNNGLAEFNGNLWTVYNAGNSLLPDNYITSICMDRKGVKWIGTQRGLIRIDKTNWTLFNSGNSQLPYNNISQVATSFNGTVWVGVQSFGLLTFDGSVWKTYTKENTGLPGHSATALAVGQFPESVWAGFARTMPRGGDEGGLAVMDNGIWYNDYSNIPSRNIHSIAIMDNNKWVCTDAGLLKFSTPQQFQVLDMTNTQLPSNNINAVARDSRGFMWIGTSGSGLVKYKMR